MSYQNMGTWEVWRKNSHMETVEITPGVKERRRVPDADSKHRVELLIDVDAIIGRMGAVATHNRLHRSKALAGAIIVTELPPDEARP